MVQETAAWFFVFIVATHLALSRSDKNCEHASSQASPQKIEDVDGVTGGGLYLAPFSDADQGVDTVHTEVSPDSKLSAKTSSGHPGRGP